MVESETEETAAEARPPRDDKHNASHYLLNHPSATQPTDHFIDLAASA